MNSKIKFNYEIFKYAMGWIEVDGFTTLVISLWLLAGLIIMLIGVTGLYIGKIFDRVKGRPTFIISETINVES